ncbi:hypothetical protein [Azorhizobium doebereinerae]|uniref:hypothetical protein n=1 Tax=Azorhizobium doebereinerae TaxID=281091 RepID=UPI000413A9EC|nr:hypothetical protein [Azorhizobium doebereinerae]
MRVAPFFILAAALTFAASAQAQTSTTSTATTQTTTTQTTNAAPKAPTRTSSAKPKRTRIEIVQRSYLDAGTVVKPGSKSYLDYALPASVRYPTNGPGFYDVVPQSASLPRQFDLPGF